jgi:hypothetical protein
MHVHLSKQILLRLTLEIPRLLPTGTFLSCYSQLRSRHSLTGPKNKIREKSNGEAMAPGNAGGVLGRGEAFVLVGCAVFKGCLSI